MDNQLTGFEVNSKGRNTYLVKNKIKQNSNNKKQKKKKKNPNPMTRVRGGQNVLLMCN